MSEEPTYKVQSILFDKDKISLNEAIEWVISHKDKIKKIDETETQYRFRQLEPTYLKRKGYTEFRTKRLNDTVSLVISYKK
jgi:hypothetical protein